MTGVHQVTGYVGTAILHSIDGNDLNSVNFPEAVIPHTGDARLCVFHKNVPAMVAQISTDLRPFR